MKNNSSVRTLWKRALKEKIVLDSVKSAALLHQQAIMRHKRKSALASDNILPDAIKIPLVLHKHNTPFLATCFIWISCQREERDGVHFTALQFPRSQTLSCKILEFCVFLEVETSKETPNNSPRLNWPSAEFEGQAALLAVERRTVKLTAQPWEQWWHMNYKI